MNSTFISPPQDGRGSQNPSPGERSRPLKKWQRTLAAITSGTLLFGSLIRMMSTPENRMLAIWRRENAVHIVVGILLVAVAVFLLRELADSLERNRRHPLVPLLGRVLHYSLWLFLGGALLSSFIGERGLFFNSVYTVFLLVWAAAFLRPAWNATLRLEKALLAFSPIFVIAGWQLFTYAPWATPKEVPPFSAASPQEKAYPVYIFLFDEWSYKRSTENDQFLPRLKNLRSLASQSYFFENAHSAGPHTFPSVPRFLFQLEKEIHVGDGRAYFKEGDSLQPTDSFPSLFKTAGLHHHKSFLIGFHIPERVLLGDQADYVHIVTFEAPDVKGRFGDTLLLANDVTNDIALRSFNWLLRKTSLRRTPETATRKHAQLVRTIESEVLDTLARSKENTFLFAHLPYPHAPFIFDETGEIVALAPHHALIWDETGYNRHLGFVDYSFGRFIETLKQHNKFDNALIVVLSDHSYRVDPDETDRRHVPMLIKLPDQKDAVTISSKVDTISLRPIIESVLEGHPEKARTLLTTFQQNPHVASRLPNKEGKGD